MQRIFYFIRILLCVILSMSMISFPDLSDAQEIINGDEREMSVRVQLTRLGERRRLDLSLTAPYQLVTEQGNILYFREGSELSFQLQNHIIYLYYQDMSQILGSSVSLERAENEDDIHSGFQVTNFPALYMGDLQLKSDGEFLRAILSIHVEDYLLGVVPYEMGDSFPLEALKAQAVAARTYALRSQNRYSDYDLVDNTNDQVFKGYLPGYEKSEQAVEETRGLCGYYQGELAQCFYSASNGGQMELVETVWGNKGKYEYYAFGEDPYDLANPESVVRRYTLPKVFDSVNTPPYALSKLAAAQIGDEISAENVRIDSVKSVEAVTPSSSGSLHMTELGMELLVSIRNEMELMDPGPEEVYLFENVNEHDTSSTLNAMPERIQGTFVSLKEPVYIHLPIFPDAEELFSLDISSNYENELWSVVENKDSFVIEVRRYGHGVGMSQRGAQWMAEAYGKSFRDILDFYYPQMQLICYPEQARRFASVDVSLSATACPAPSPTPRPTLMPVTQKLEAEQWYAVVTEISDNSSLNLRAEPNLNGNILMRLYKGQKLVVLERCKEVGWVHVRTDTAEGYVMESYLTAE